MKKPTKAQKIRDYISSHPDKSVAQVASALRVIPAYVYKIKSELKPIVREEPQVENVTRPALDRQVGGAHYKNRPIQPVEYSFVNKLNGLEASIVKRITRWRDKDGFQDLEKIKHEVDLLIELESKYNAL